MPYTPIDIHRLSQDLASHPDPAFVHYLIQGLAEGFDTGVKATPNIKTFETENVLSARKDPETVTALLNNEVDKGYLIGPFITPPFKTYRVSPIGLVEKKFSSKKRLIVDLSAPREHPIHPSINSLISKDECSLSYVRIDDAISIICSLGQQALLCKTDITDAFKQLPIAPHLWNLYGVKWQGLYFFHTRLPFGSRSSPRIFDNLSQALCWIAKNKYGISHILHLLDDYLTIDPPNYPAQKTMNSLLMLFDRLNIPLSASKTFGSSRKI